MSFGGVLRQSTAVDVLIGPFVDSADGNSEETTLTISQADVRLSKNGQTAAQKNDNTACAHDANGFYNCELDATDTNTVGQLTLFVHESGALMVRHDYQVIEEAAYDAIYAASAAPATAAGVSAVETDTQDIQSRLPTALVNSRMDCTIDGTGMEAGAVTAVQSGLATAAALATAQTDLDTITGSDGVTLATTQGNYAPATAASLATAQSDLDTITGADGVVIASGTQTFNMTGNVTGNLSGSVGSVTGLTASNVGDIKTKTDQLTFGVTNTINANVTYINETEVTGDGDGTPWGPA